MKNVSRFFVSLAFSFFFVITSVIGAENWTFSSLTPEQAQTIAEQPVLPNTSFSVSGADVSATGARLERFENFLSDTTVAGYNTRNFNLGLRDESFVFQLRQYTDPNDPFDVGVTYNNGNFISGFEFPYGEYTLKHNILLEITMPEGVNSTMTIGGKSLSVPGGSKEYCLITGDDNRHNPVSLYTSMNIIIDVPEGVPYDNAGIRFKFGFFDTASVPEPGTSLFMLTLIAGILRVRRINRRA